MKKNIALTLLIFLVSLAFNIPALSARESFSDLIPELPGWEVRERSIKEFKAPSGNYGTWEFLRMNLTDTLKTMDVHCFRGEGTGEFYIPSCDIDTDDRPIGFGASYRTLDIGGYRAVLEKYPYIGKALSIDAGNGTVLCIESNSLSEDELIEAGLLLLGSIKE